MRYAALLVVVSRRVIAVALYMLSESVVAAASDCSRNMSASILESRIFVRSSEPKSTALIRVLPQQHTIFKTDISCMQNM